MSSYQNLIQGRQGFDKSLPWLINRNLLLKTVKCGNNFLYLFITILWAKITSVYRAYVNDKTVSRKFKLFYCSDFVGNNKTETYLEVSNCIPVLVVGLRQPLVWPAFCLDRFPWQCRCQQLPAKWNNIINV